jgi:hypothetical protein
MRRVDGLLFWRSLFRLVALRLLASFVMSTKAVTTRLANVTVASKGRTRAVPSFELRIAFTSSRIPQRIGTLSRVTARSFACLSYLTIRQNWSTRARIGLQARRRCCGRRCSMCRLMVALQPTVQNIEFESSGSPTGRPRLRFSKNQIRWRCRLTDVC